MAVGTHAPRLENASSNRTYNKDASWLSCNSNRYPKVRGCVRSPARYFNRTSATTIAQDTCSQTAYLPLEPISRLVPFALQNKTSKTDMYFRQAVASNLHFRQR